MQERNGTPAAPPSEDTLSQALEEYLEAAEAGKAPPRAEFLARYPELAEYLDGCLAALRFIGRAAQEPGSIALDRADVQPPEQVVGQLGDFRIIREVGRGGMGVVYEAEQVSLGRRVALKVLPFAATMDQRQIQRFHNEARAAALLDHPHIVHVHAVGCERAVHFYAMQFIEGQTLAQMIADLRLQNAVLKKPAARHSDSPAAKPGDSLPTQAYAAEPVRQSAICNLQSAMAVTPPAALSTVRTLLNRAYFRRAAELGIQAAEALDHAHTLGIVHRDVKPANLLLDGRGNLWVTDFGLAHMQSDARLTMTGDLVGTLRYMSPEQALAKRVVVDHCTDVYSLGATLYELLTLEPAYRGNDRQELLRQIAFEEPRPPRRVDRAIPAELETIVQKAMEKNPADRYATSKELADDLRRYLADEPIRARPASAARRLRKWGRRHPAWVAAAATALTTAVAMLSAGIGWQANDWATRHEATQQAVAAAQAESVGWQQRGRLPEALAAARRADGLVKGGTPSDALTQQVQARLADLELLDRLENARLEGSAAVLDNHFDVERCDALFREIFRGADLDVEALPAQEAGRRIRGMTVAVELAALLDDWAMIRRIDMHLQGQAWKHLLQVARDADPDDGRGRVRAALDGKERAALVAVAASVDADLCLPATVRALEHALESVSAAEQAEALLRGLRQRRPDDFCANEWLGLLLNNKRPPQLVEATRHFAVAVALRPRSPGARLNLGVALRANKDVDGAIAEYREAIDLDPKYANAHNNLGIALVGKKDVDGAIAAYRKAIDLDPKFAYAHNNLGYALCKQGKLDEAVAECRKAIELDPKFAYAHYNLGTALYDQKKLDEAIAAYRKAIDLDPKHAVAHYNLGNALRDKKDLDGAIVAYKKAIDLDPKLANAHNNLGNALRANKEGGAIAEYRKAIDLDPKLADAHYNLGNALVDKKDVDGAIAAYRKAIDLDPKLADAHNGLGNALVGKKDVDGAIAAYRKAIELDPKYAYAHNGLGNALVGKKDVDGAIAAYRKAIELDPKYANAHNNLGIALVGKKDVDGAIAAYRKAIELDPDHADVHCNLGHLLRSQGQFAEALTCLRRGHELGLKNPRWPYPSAQWVKQCEGLVALDAKLTRVLKGELEPANASERLMLAKLCQLPGKSLFAAAVRFYAGAFAEQPNVEANLQAQHRYNAACAAALAGTADKAEEPMTKTDRPALRRQARDWLRADLDLYARQVKDGKAASILLAEAQLAHWQADPDFIGVRDGKALANLPDAEQAEWRKLWADVDQLLGQVRSHITETALKGSLTDTQHEQVHEMNLQAGKTYVTDMKSKYLDSYLKLYDAAGKLVAENDDIAPNNLDARIVYMPKETGVYRITATSFEQRGRGAYTLTIRTIRAVGK